MPTPDPPATAGGTDLSCDGVGIKEGQLVFTRKLVQNSATVPAERYKAVREFFGRIRASEESPIVLAKK